MYQFGTIFDKDKTGYTHCALYIGYGQVLQNIHSRGEEIISIDEFFDGARITTRNLENIDFQAVLQRVAYIQQNPMPYDLLTRNCEHTVYWALTGVAKSPQLRFAVGVGLALSVIAIAVKSRSS